MGVGMVIVCAEIDVQKIKSHIEKLGEKCFEIGKVVEGNKEVKIL
jgi:phosphoribosylaminoimidazole (AIR) synthetase